MLLAITATIHCFSNMFIAIYQNITQFLNISFCRELRVLFIDVFDLLFSRFGIKVYLFEVNTNNNVLVEVGCWGLSRKMVGAL